MSQLSDLERLKDAAIKDYLDACITKDCAESFLAAAKAELNTANDRMHNATLAYTTCKLRNHKYE